MTSCGLISASPVTDQTSRGQSIYQQGCEITTCHGDKGEGILSQDSFSVWPLVGEEFQRRNPNAQVIFDVVRSGGEASLRALTDQQIYDAIAYELSLNQVDLSEPLVTQNAPFISTGPAAEQQNSGTLFPPPGNTSLISAWVAPTLPATAENNYLRIRLTQIALASSVGGAGLPDAGKYLFAVFTVDVLTDLSIEVGPQYLELVTQEGQILAPLEMNIEYPVTRFYPQMIEFEHGTVALAIFALPGTANIGQIRYTQPNNIPLILDLSY